MTVAAQSRLSLAHKRRTPHVICHPNAMLLGHEPMETKQIYLDANLTIKEQALARIMPIAVTPTATERMTSC